MNVASGDSQNQELIMVGPTNHYDDVLLHETLTVKERPWNAIDDVSAWFLAGGGVICWRKSSCKLLEFFSSSGTLPSG